MINKLIVLSLWVLTPSLYAEIKSVLIEQEPHHKLVFENNYVRVFDAQIPPGDQTIFHVHNWDNISVPIYSGTGVNQLLGKDPTNLAPIAGKPGLSKATYTHRVKNQGDTPLRFILAEIKPTEALTSESANSDRDGYQLVLENDRVRVYKLFVEPGQMIKIRSRTQPWLRIVTSVGSVISYDTAKSSEMFAVNAGDIAWYGSLVTQSLKNVGAERYQAVEIEWK